MTSKRNLIHPLPHKFVRRNIGSGKNPYFVYKCILLDCTTYYRPELADGMATLCNVCEEPTVVSKDVVTPICDSCKYPVKNSEVIEILEKLIAEQEQSGSLRE